MSTSRMVGLSDMEMNMLLDDDPEATEARERTVQAESALAEAYQAISQVTGATVPEEGDEGQEGNAGPVRAIWGSSLEVANLMRQAFQFVGSFKKRNAEAGSEPYYIRQLRQLRANSTHFINLDLQNVLEFDRDLYEAVVAYPQETIPIFDAVYLQIYKSLFMNDENQEEMDAMALETRPFNLRRAKTMRDLDPEDLDTLVSLQGMIIRTSSVLPDMHVGFFECSECKATVANRVQDGRILEPTICDRCRMRDTMTLIHNRCVYIDKQVVKLQESPESVPEGATPQTVQLATHATLVDVCKPGDKVMVTGIYRASEVRQLAGQSNARQLFKTYIDVVHFKRTSKGSLSSGGNLGGANEAGIGAGNAAGAQHRRRAEMDSALEDFGTQPIEAEHRPRTEEELKDDDDAQLNDGEEIDLEEKAREGEYRRLAARPDIYDVLVRSLAPSIWEMDDVKRGILCQLFGGSSKMFAEKSTGKFRSEINVLLCGDPGTSKSQLLQYVHKLAPRGIYTSGKGSSAVGLTAYITKDEDTGESVLESGALTLSDRGICCIDEFDKMSDATRSILHEAMEQQTVSVAKAGIIATLNARTSILASANPRESRYNKRLSVVENIQLPPTLLSRFDLIYLVLDNPQRESDARLARHIVDMYRKDRIQSSAKNDTSNRTASTFGVSTLDADNNDDDATDVTSAGQTASSSAFGASTASLGGRSRPEESAAGLSLSTDTLRKYIAFAKRVCTPLLSDDAGQALVNGYVEMRRGGASMNTITATTRQLESLVRLSEALAKMRLSPLVHVEDVKEAIRLMQVATYKAALDPLTGRLDMDLINTGRGAAQEMIIRNLVQMITDLIRQFSTDTVHEEQLWSNVVALSSDPVQQVDFFEALNLLQEDAVISITGVGRSRLIRRL